MSIFPRGSARPDRPTLFLLCWTVWPCWSSILQASSTSSLDNPRDPAATSKNRQRWLELQDRKAFLFNDPASPVSWKALLGVSSPTDLRAYDHYRSTSWTGLLDDFESKLVFLEKFENRGGLWWSPAQGSGDVRAAVLALYALPGGWAGFERRWRETYAQRSSISLLRFRRQGGTTPTNQYATRWCDLSNRYADITLYLENSGFFWVGRAMGAVLEREVASGRAMGAVLEREVASGRAMGAVLEREVASAGGHRGPEGIVLSAEEVAI